MKKIIFTLLAILTISTNANALSVQRSREEARFLTDKMAYELDLTDDQLQDVYEINYDYFRSLGPVGNSYDNMYNRRYEYMSYILYDWQWDEFLARDYFRTPVYIYRGGWAFSIYNYYNRTRFFYGIPSCYHHYRGGHFSRPAYYRGRVDMHRRAMNGRPRPQEMRRPEQNRPHMGQPNRRPNDNASLNRRPENRPNNNHNGVMNRPNENRGQTYRPSENSVQTNRPVNNREVRNANRENSNNRRSESTSVRTHERNSSSSTSRSHDSSTRSSSSSSRSASRDRR